MQYSSQKVPLIIAEYGRNIHKLISHCKTIEDKEERQNFANAVVHLMSQIVPQQHARQDYYDKLWKHFFRMAQFDIDVTPSNGSDVPEPTVNIIQPQKVEYPTRNSTHRHYGIQIKDLIKKAIEMEDGEKKQEFLKIIGSFMKLAYKNWNREHYVSDQIIKEDLITISEGKLKIEDEVSLDGLMKGMKKSRKHQNSHSNKRHKGGKSKSNNNKKRHRRY